MPHVSPKLILFDFDGTIADSLPLMVDVFRHIALQHRHRHLYHLTDLVSSDQPLLDHPTVDKLRRQGLKPAMTSLKLKKWQLALFYLRAQRRFNRQINQLQPIPGMAEVLPQLAENFRLGIVTSNQAKTVQKFLDNHQLNHFDFIKSQPNLFGKSRTIARLIAGQGLNLADVVYVGDEVRDIEAAQQAGIASVAVSWGLNHHDLLAWHDPTAIINQPQQLPQAIERIFNP